MIRLFGLEVYCLMKIGDTSKIKKPGCHYPAFQKGEKESVNLRKLTILLYVLWPELT
jgi:hypothetical protein